ncbi:MAG: transglutaminase family protein [Planctomycetaceae bacterium]
MPIRVALHHQTEYRYDRRVAVGPQVIRLRPAPHCRTPITAYSLTIEPADHFINWQQDPHGNFLARVILHDKTDLFRVAVDLVAEMTVINPFDFFLEKAAEEFPFRYADELSHDLKPFLARSDWGATFDAYRAEVDLTPRRTMDFLVDLNLRLQEGIGYLIRMEPGVQSPEETLQKQSGSCRDSAWLLVQLLRSFGLAARFVSGYLIQLTPDVKPLEGPEGPPADFTDLHAWTEVFLPGAGWVGLDPTSGLLTGEGHIPLAATPIPQSAAPISGGVEKCECDFRFDMSVTRIHEDPRVTKPYSEEEWNRIDAVGGEVDARLKVNDVRLTMGGEPTFVSIDDQEGAEWNTAAVGHDKQRKSDELIRRLRDRFGPGGMLHYGQGKWYPGESLPRWAYSCIWRKDGEPVWKNADLLARPDTAADPAVDAVRAGTFLHELADRLEVDDHWIRPAYEDIYHMIELEQKLPVDLDPTEYDPDSTEDRRRLAMHLERGVGKPVGFVLPLTRAWWQAGSKWTSGPWPFRSRNLYLIPGDSPIGLRLPLESLPSGAAARSVRALDPFVGRDPLPGYAELRLASRQARRSAATPDVTIETQERPSSVGAGQESGEPVSQPQSTATNTYSVIPTALCVEPRNGRLYVFMPPTGTLEDYLELVAFVEETADGLNQPVVIEGYPPPTDHRIQTLKVTPDPGVIEVNVHPAADWQQLKEITLGVYEDARSTRLGTEKFQRDGRHTGTGGGNHLVLGGPTPADSPFLRRPDLLRSVLAFWNNHPSLSYLFSSLFIGPTSQSPRIDEGRADALYELEIAFRQVPDDGDVAPWLVDRLFRHLLVDITGNTHRAELCIDKLYSPDHAGGRLGLVELRGFEMPPHPRMSLTQQLLVRALVAAFWKYPYRENLIHWGTAIHDRFMLPYYLQQDLQRVVETIHRAGLDFDAAWFAPHVEFRCPRIGEFEQAGIHVEVRQAIEPWYVLGEEPGGGGMTRYVDSSLERVQVFVKGLFSDRYVVCCNGFILPLQSAAVRGEFVGGVRYRAWQPPSCLHPTIPVQTPLIFDIVDRWNGRSLGGCRYHVEHPGGLNPAALPVNALEAESRRATRFFRMGHTGGTVSPIAVQRSVDFPCTLDLRRV